MGQLAPWHPFGLPFAPLSPAKPNAPQGISVYHRCCHLRQMQCHMPGPFSVPMLTNQPLLGSQDDRRENC